MASAEAKQFAIETAQKMREFHQEDLQSLREYMDIKFESVDRRLDTLAQESNQTSSALSELLFEFRTHREEIAALKSELADVRSRLEVLETRMAAA